MTLTVVPDSTCLQRGAVERIKKAVVRDGCAAVVALLASVGRIVLEPLRRRALQAGQVRRGRHPALAVGARLLVPLHEAATYFSTN